MFTTKTHGYLDYLMGLLLIMLPFLSDTIDGTAATILWVMGAGTIVYSLLTDYELGLYKMISMNMHLMIDILGGLFLMSAPWVFGFADRVYLPFVILGAFEVVAALLTNKVPPVDKVKDMP